MSIKFLSGLAALAAVAVLAVAAPAGARSSSVCSYKMRGYAVWMRFSNTPRSACAAFVQSANGSMVPASYVAGSPRCQFEGLGGMVATMYGNSEWGPLACKLMSPSLKAQGWTKIF